MHTHEETALQKTHDSGKLGASSLVKRLTLPKFFFREARVALSNHGPYSGGMATSLLQDSVESFLRVVSEYGGIDARDTAPFNDLFGRIGEKYQIVVEHKAAISRMNRARVAFKHHGLTVSKEDARGFVTAVEAFLVEVSHDVLKVDFKLVSLISQIGHLRTENWLHKAEDLAKKGDHKSSLICTSKAMSVYMNYSSMWIDPWQHNGRTSWVGFLDEQQFDLLASLSMVEEQLDSIRTHLDLMMQGVDLVAYRRFRELTPAAHITYDNTIIVNDNWPIREAFHPSEEDSYFCIEFVVESALQILNSRPPGWSYDHPKEQIRHAVAKHMCDVIVHPREESPEIIRSVAVGETLSVIRISCESHPNYAEVLQDDDICYVLRNCIFLPSDGTDSA